MTINAKAYPSSCDGWNGTVIVGLDKSNPLDQAIPFEVICAYGGKPGVSTSTISVYSGNSGNAGSVNTTSLDSHPYPNCYIHTCPSAITDETTGVKYQFNCNSSHSETCSSPYCPTQYYKMTVNLKGVTESYGSLYCGQAAVMFANYQITKSCLHGDLDYSIRVDSSDNSFPATVEYSGGSFSSLTKDVTVYHESTNSNKNNVNIMQCSTSYSSGCTFTPYFSAGHVTINGTSIDAYASFGDNYEVKFNLKDIGEESVKVWIAHDEQWNIVTKSACE